VLQSKVPPFIESEVQRYSVAGKVFILGEYAVLAQLPGLIAAIPPRFSLSATSGASSTAGSFAAPNEVFHPDSPIARLQAWAEEMNWPDLEFGFEDPLAGAGGFGASTAQFAMAYLAYAQKMNVGVPGAFQVWHLYRELMKDDLIVPSGADLVAQWQGGVSFFDPKTDRCVDLWDGFDWSGLLVFSATRQKGRKVPTHQHLRTLRDRGFPEKEVDLMARLQQTVLKGVAAIREKAATQLGAAMDDYAEYLAAANLEVPATRADREALRGLPGVLGVKGAGALQSDAVLVLLESGHSGKEQVLKLAQDRGLVLVVDGLEQETGVLCQKKQ
jgi:mevalonate kinase